MRVAYDCGPLLDASTGVGRYTRELGGALEARGVELARYAVSYGGPQTPGVARWRVPARVMQAAWKRLDLPAVTRLTGPTDLVHGTNFILPALGGRPGVLTVHDLSFFRSDTFPGGERLRTLVPWSVSRAAVVLTPTRAIAGELMERYGLEEGRIVVTPEGVSPSFFGAAPLSATALGAMGTGERLVVAAGTLEPRKNLARLLEAWRAARLADKGWTLLVAGPPGWGPELAPTPGVSLLGWLGDETLPGLLAAAEFFCYPSLYEGFGLPPLEAMAAGTPVLAGGYSAASEVLGEAALIVDPLDVDALGGALERLASDDDLRQRLGRAGRRRAAGYSWERCAALTQAAYEQALA